MKFKVKKIQTRSTRVKNKWWRKIVRNLGPKKSLTLAILLAFVLLLWGGSALVKSDLFLTKATRSIFSFGPLKKDKHGHTNILFLGVAGEGSEGGNLSDSIMIASFNPAEPTVSFLSLPRDLFVSSKVGDRKVNEIYAAAKFKYKDDKRGLSIMKDAISNFTGVDIHYGAVVNFKIFEELVDAMNGIDIFVPEDIADPFYPDENYGYQTFVVRKGLQKFDGSTALKYARSRKTSSDYDRARRQQDLLLAIRKRAEELSLLTDFDKLRQFYDIYKSNLTTDLGITELIALAKMAMTIDYSNALVAVLNNDPTKKGGFLYTPAKEFYGGQFVLLPENLKDTQLFMDLVLIHPEVFLENAQLSILNGSKMDGKATQTAHRLRRLGLHVIEVANYDSDTPVFRTFLKNFTTEEKPRTLKILQHMFNIETIEDIPEEYIPEGNLIDYQMVIGTN